MTIKETVGWFGSIFDVNKGEGQEKGDFRVGRTSDIERVRAEDRTVNLLGFTRCGSPDVAGRLVEAMRDDGFGTEEGRIEDGESSVFVYLYRRSP